jgi:hypothetical protein
MPGGVVLPGYRYVGWHSLPRGFLLPRLAAQRRHGSVHGRLFLPFEVDRVERRGHVFTRFILSGRLLRSEWLGSMHCWLLLPSGLGSRRVPDGLILP